MTSLWQILQLSDSSFPTGGFAHSSGLEAALQHGEVIGAVGFERFLSQSMWQVGYGNMPLVNVAYQRPERLRELDEIGDAFLSNHVANRASRVQGRTFFSTCRRSFECDFTLIEPSMEHEDFCSHYASLFGATFQALGVDFVLTQKLHLYLAMRGVISAGIRLGIVGPYEAQRIQYKFAGVLTEVFNYCQSFEIVDLAQTAPHLDIYQSNHDRLYSRLFQS